MEKVETKTDEKPGYMYRFTTDLGSGRMLEITGNFPLGASVESMNTELDKLRTVTDRQQAKSAIEGVKAKIKGLETQVNAQETDLAELQVGENGRMTTQQKTTAENLRKSIPYGKKLIEDERAYLAQLEEQAK